jgi:iron complex outermembrane receptor protein
MVFHATRAMWLRHRVKDVFLLSLLGALPGAFAEDGLSPISERDFLGDLPVVLSVSRLAQPASEAPSAVTVIDREMIKASGFRELADVFRLVPGFYVGYSTGNEPVVGRGLISRYFGRIQVLVDGRSVYTPMFGQVQWPLLPLALEDIERIEVTRGPNAASYGANSFLGVINIITRHPVQDQGTLVSVRGGDPAVKDGLVRHGGTAGGWDYRVTVAHKEDSGFPARNDSQAITQVSMRADRRVNDVDSLQVQAGYAGGTFGEGYYGDLVDVPRDRQVASAFQQIRWLRTFAADDELSVQFYHTQQQNREQADITIVPAIVRLEQDSERFDLEAQRTQGFGQSLRVVWGGSARLDRVYAPLYLGDDDVHDISLQRLFGHVEWRPALKWVVNAGAMAEHNELTGTDVSPQLAVSYHFNPRHTVRVGVSEALRTPTLLEDAAHYVVLGSPEYISAGGLKPERIFTKELAYLANLPKAGLEFDVRVYEDDIRDIIMADKMGASYWQFFNGNSLTLQGVETQLRWHWGGTRLALAHAYTRNRDVSGVSASAATTLDRSNPIHSLSGLLSHTFANQVEASVGYYHYSEMYPIGDGDFLPAYGRWDVRLAKKFQMGAQRAEAALVFQNITGTYRDYMWDLTQPAQRNDFESRALATLSLEF